MIKSVSHKLSEVVACTSVLMSFEGKFGDILKEINRFTGFIRQNKLICAVFLFSLSFFIYQHASGFSWDFAAYTLNAKYLAGGGYYFEWGRSPLPSVILLPLGVFGWIIAEYLFIILVSFLHLYSSLKFSERFSVDKNAFYVFSMNAFVLTFGLKMGSELLSLALLQLFAAYLSRKRSGIFAGLFLLARYSNLNFLVLLLAKRSAKKIILSALLALLVLSPWLYFNYTETANPLTSIRDSYMLNVVFRKLDGYVNQFNFFDLLLSLNILLPFFAAGLFARRNEKYYIMLAFFAVSVASYFLVPFKEERYLFPLTLPAAYFASRGLEKMSKRHMHKVLPSFFIITVALLFLLLPLARNEPPYFYKSIKSDCMVQSNAWIPLNYYGVPSEPYPNKEEFQLSVDKGYRIILFKHTGSPDYLKNWTFLSMFPVIEDNDGFVMYGDASRCKQPEKYEMLFDDRIRGRIESGDIGCSLFSCRYLK